MKTKHSQHKKIKAVSKHICNSHNPTHIPKTAKELALGLIFLMIVAFNSKANAQLPTVTTGSATSITTNSATLNGTVNPNGSAASYVFQWGTTTSYGNNSTITNLSAGSSPVSVSVPVSGLQPNTTYHYRISASTSAGAVNGSDKTFTSLLDINCNITDLIQETESYTAACYLMQNGIINERTDVEPTKKIIKQDIAKIVYKAVYGANSNPSVLNFPTYYQDLLIANKEYHDYAIMLSYLEFGDGISPFDRDLANFYPLDSLSRKFYVKVLFEAFNIPTDITLSNPFTDVSNEDPMHKYLVTAYYLGLTNQTKFRPNEGVTREEAFLMLYRILNNNSISKPTVAQLGSEDNYHIPLNLTRQNASSGLGILNGETLVVVGCCFNS